MTFKEKLVILRKTRGITQDEFASAVGVSRQAVYKWECGQSYPEVPKLLEIKLLFGISIDNLLDDTFEVSLPEKKKRKRLSKEAMRLIEESVENTEATDTEKASEIARVVAEPAPVVVVEEPQNTVEEEIEVEVTVEETVEEPVLITVAAEEVPVIVEAKEEVNATAEVEASPAEEADTEKTEPAAELVAEKKKGFFGRLFGKK